MPEKLDGIVGVPSWALGEGELHPQGKAGWSNVGSPNGESGVMVKLRRLGRTWDNKAEIKLLGLRYKQDLILND